MMRIPKFRFVLLVIVLMGAIHSGAQSFKPMHPAMNNWYFGNSSKALTFNRITKSPTIVNNKFTPFSTGGAATASDPSNGNLLFYTDGYNIYDAYNLIMPAGSGLLGPPIPSNQPVAICPVPGQPGKYFVFVNSATNTGPGNITYDVVDMGSFGNAPLLPLPQTSPPPFGDLEIPTPNPAHTAVLGLTGRSEAMIIIPHTNGTDYWLITQQFNSNSYSATRITAASYNPIHTGIFTTTPSLVGTNAFNASHFAANGLNIAVAPSTANVNAIIMTLNEGTGNLVLTSDIANSAVGTTNGQAIYDIEWSGDGHYVYLSISGDPGAGVPGDVLQFDFVNQSITLTSALPSTVFRSWGLQLAPDSSIYHIYQTGAANPFLIGKIDDPDSVAANVNYVSLPLDNSSWLGTQFPALIPQVTPIINVSFTTAGGCQNSPTSFYPTVTPAADSLIWDFGDGSPTVNAWSPVYTYQNSGPVNATVTAFYLGRSQVSLPVTVNVAPFALQLQLVADTTACTFEFPPPVGTSGPPPFSVTATVSGGTAATSVWSNGDTGLTLTPDSAGYYYIVIGDGSSCTAYAGVNVKEYGVPDQWANTWYFGNLAGIDFNKTPPVALDDSQMNAPEGCSAMSDRNGDIIFYTDGNNVYDQDHTLIASNIGGNTSASQSALIVPVNGDETLYYIFTTEANSDYPTNTVYYSLFDLKQNSGKGAVVQQHIPLFNGSTERLTSNGNWLIAHEYGNNSFRCYPVGLTGIGEPVITSIGSSHSYQNPTQAEGYMKLSANNVLAVPLSTLNVSNVIEVFDFIDSSGVLTNFRSVDLQESTAQVYGIEFSGSKMIASLTGTPSFIREAYFDFQNNPVLIPPVAANSGPFAEELGAIQEAPDGQIYMAVNGSNSLGLFTINPDTLQLSTVNFSGFALAAGTTSNLGLPSFVQAQGNAFSGPNYDIAGVCFGSPLDYVAFPTDNIDTFLWGFGDGATSTLDSGQHNYATPGTYTVTLQINNRCLIHDGIAPFSFNETFTLVAPPAIPTIPPTTAICTTPITLDANTLATPGQTYLWSTGATTRQISVSAIDSYTVTITDASGCTSAGTTDLFDGRPPVDLGPDLTQCEGDPTITLNAQNPPPSFSHVWTLDGVANGNTLPTQTVSTATPGVDVYEVTVTNLTTGCQTVDAVTFTTNEAPNFSLSSINTGGCTLANGQIDINITALTQTTQPPNHTFSYFVSGPVQASDFQLNVGIHNVFNLRAGSYSVIVQDDISGCTSDNNIGVDDPANTLTAPDENTCTTASITGTTNANTVPIAGNFTYQVFDTNNAVVNSGTRNAAIFTTGALSPGIYTLVVTKGTCRVTEVVEIIQDPQITFTTLADVCTTPNQTITASSATPGVTYAWTGPSIVSGAASPTVNINPGAGSFNYVVTASVAGLCTTTSPPVSVTIEAPPIPAITASDPCQTQVTLSATPASSSFSYQWYRNGAIDLALLGQQVSLTPADDGDQFEVELVSSTSGCPYRSAPPLVASVLGPVTAGLTSTAACDDGSAFLISAVTSATTPTYTWSRNIGPGYIVIAGETNSTTSQTIAASYKVLVEQGVCSAEAEIDLAKLPLPVGELPNVAVICDDPENADPATNHVDLDPGVFVSYNWFVKQTEDSPEVGLGVSDQVYTADRKAFYYRVELTNSFGCTASDFTEVVNDCTPKLYAPNAFRPASSITDNKVFAVKSFFITDEFKVFIFNRWGELVFQSDDRFFTWNGGRENNASVPLPSGAYAYLIQYVSAYRPDEGVQEKRGGVVLLR